MARNRVIYQSQAVFISPSSTGYHMQTGNSNSQEGGTGTADLSENAYWNTHWTGVTGISTTRWSVARAGGNS